MVFDWKEYFKQSEFLIRWSGDEFNEESAKRSGVSRAYYGVFCLFRDYAANIGAIEISGESEDHSALRRYFRRSGDIVTYEELNDIRTWRNQCDYDNEIDNINRLARDALRTARKLIVKYDEWVSENG